MTSRIHRLVLVLVPACLLLGMQHVALSQTLGNRPIKLVVPYTPGGPADAATRILAEEISPILGVPVLVENNPGATGKIAAEAVKNAEPDGHTLLVGGTPQLIILPLLDKTVRYKPLDDFRMISIFMNYDIVFMAGESTGLKTMKDLLAKMKTKNNDVSFASIGQPQLTPPGLAYLVFAKMYDGTAQDVVYKGQAPGMLDLLAGRVTFAAYTLTGALQHIQSGKLVALAVASPQRLPQLPNVPTMAEAGFPEFETANNWVSWVAMVAPAKTPEPILATINKAVVQAVQSASFKQKIAAVGLNPQAAASAVQDHAAWRAEYERLAATLKRFDIRAPD